jgi:hypothetical protein
MKNIQKMNNFKSYEEFFKESWIFFKIYEHFLKIMN